jgi:hypothetical protein
LVMFVEDEHNNGIPREVGAPQPASMQRRSDARAGVSQAHGHYYRSRAWPVECGHYFRHITFSPPASRPSRCRRWRWDEQAARCQEEPLHRRRLLRRGVAGRVGVHACRNQSGQGRVAEGGGGAGSRGGGGDVPQVAPEPGGGVRCVRRCRRRAAARAGVLRGRVAARLAAASGQGVWSAGATACAWRRVGVAGRPSVQPYGAAC